MQDVSDILAHTSRTQMEQPNEISGSEAKGNLRLVGGDV